MSHYFVSPSLLLDFPVHFAAKSETLEKATHYGLSK